MKLKALTLLSALGLLAATAACEKASPARPTDLQAADAAPVSVTDARTGVTIVAARPVSPADNAQISWASQSSQPITLTVTNAVSTGKTALTYTFEVSDDSGFTNRAFFRDGVAQGSGTQTSQAVDRLPGSKTYYWRVKVLSGTTVGPTSAVRSFTVGPEVILGIPSPISPANNGTAFTPIVLTTSNVSRTGPAGAITYHFELSTSSSFGSLAFSAIRAEGDNNQTSATVTGNLTTGATYFWRVQASDATNGITTPFSSVFAFQPQSFSWDGVTMHNSPPDFPAWPETARITSIDFTRDAFEVEFDRRVGPGRWTDQLAFGNDGYLQYTLGMCFNLAGGWHCSGVVQFWFDRSLADSAPPRHIALEWFYDARWGIMAGHQPEPGELIGIFVGAGNQRNQSYVRATCPQICERSNLALFNFPDGPAFLPFSSPIRSILRMP